MKLQEKICKVCGKAFIDKSRSDTAIYCSRSCCKKVSDKKYYLKNKDNIRKTCKIFDCKKSTLQRWIQRYNSTKNLTRRNRKPLSYKISKPQVKTALELLKQNEQLTMN